MFTATMVATALWVSCSGAHLVPAPASSREKCPPAKAKQAEEEASDLQRWKAVFDSYQRFKACDSGSIQEAYGDSITLLFSDHWEQLGELLALTRKNARFERFVLRHLDELTPIERSRRIEENARSHCPTEGHAFCDRILQRFREVDEEIRKERQGQP